ncbi:MAG: PadR family transcriptional regulator [Roseiflexaceae bacterium]
MSPRQKEPLTYEHALLGFVVSTPLHAYALHLALVRSPLGQVWHLKQSACYAMISRLVDEAYIDIRGEEPTVRGKRMLECTAAGYAAFATWIIAPVAHPRDMRIEFLAKLYFASQQSAAHRSTLICAQQAKIAYWYTDAPVSDQFTADVHAYRRGQIDAIALWLDHLTRYP